MRLYIILLLLPMTAWAESYVCPSTYQTVMTGYTLDQVIAACGKPTEEQGYDTNINKPIQLEQWVYTLPKMPLQNMSQSTPQLTITFKDEQVDQIVSSNDPANTLFPCNRNNRLSIGYTTDQVRAQCGLPNFINTLQQGSGQKVHITQLTYNFGSYRPLMIFISQDGTLSQIKMGPLAK